MSADIEPETEQERGIRLWVTDIDEVLEQSLKTGQTIEELSTEDAVALLDTFQEVLRGETGSFRAVSLVTQAISRFTDLSPTGVEERIASVAKLLLTTILNLYQKHDGDESVVRSHCLEMSTLLSDCCDREDDQLKQVL